MLTVSATDLGTPESVWRTDRGLADAPILDAAFLFGRRPHVVVVAPHPDDEVLGAGGLLQAAARAGCHIDVVAVTDGEASHPGSSWTGERMAARRRLETTTARRRLGIARAGDRRLSIPDGRVREHEQVVADHLTALLGLGAVCVATWRHDGHPDHDATGRAAAVAAARTGARLLEHPVWAWHWARSSADLPMARARRLPLGVDERSAKTLAIDAYTSQIHPLGTGPADAAILPPAVRTRFERSDELHFLADGAS